ncbi:MAG: sigma-70 family RNA polymerase sigma factor [Treponema sp.]|jgi:RNA polymerase sigma factor (sigma-70 family)|nr:sigma-70 family RNA polymerase sigma factor [Treponema sp.]
MSKNSVAEVFALYRERLLKFIRLRVRDMEDAEDILQDVFYQFSRMDSLAKPVAQTAAWLYRSTRNRIIDHQRQKKAEKLPAVYDEEEDDYIFDEIVDIVFGEEATPEIAYLRSMIFEEITIAVNDLPEEQRSVFEQTEFLGIPVKEIAEKTRTPVNTILSRKHYAVVFLRKRLKDLYADVMLEKG